MIIQYEQVSSSNVFSAAYCEELQMLLIRFNNNSVYGYQDVPPDIYQKFLEAKSKGGFIHQYLHKYITKQVPKQLGLSMDGYMLSYFYEQMQQRKIEACSRRFDDTGH